MQRIIAGLFILIAVAANAETLTGKVVGVHDGDTLTLLSPGNVQTKVRLAEIDTPESNQPYGTQAKKSLSDMVYGQNARVEVAEKDRYGRTVGRVYVGNVDVNRELVRSGSAWVYRQYLSDKSLLAVEDEAKNAKRGLWGLPESQRIPPWEWRRGKPVAATVAPVTSQPGVTQLEANLLILLDLIYNLKKQVVVKNQRIRVQLRLPAIHFFRQS